jgi:hypothetical protein
LVERSALGKGLAFSIPYFASGTSKIEWIVGRPKKMAYGLSNEVGSCRFHSSASEDLRRRG